MKYLLTILLLLPLIGAGCITDTEREEIKTEVKSIIEEIKQELRDERQFGGDVSVEDENTAVSTLESVQATYKTGNSKYQFVPSAKVGDLTYTVHEHQMPDGNVGYVIYLFKTVDEQQYVKIIGSEDGSLNRYDADWQEYNPDEI